MKYLLPLLAACSPIPGELAERCSEEIAAVDEACDNADVRGTNENKELYSAVDAAKDCIGDEVKVICSDDGWTHFTRWSYNR